METLRVFSTALVGIFATLSVTLADNGPIKEINVGVRIEKIAFTTDGDRAFAIASGGKRVLLIDLRQGITKDLIDEKSWGPPVSYSDFAVSHDERYLYLAGARKEKFGEGVLSRLDLENGGQAQIAYYDQFDSPSIAVDNKATVYVADTSSSIISVLEESDFVDDQISLANRGGTPNSLFHRGGIPSDLEIDPDGQVLWVQHQGSAELTGIDTRSGSIVANVSEYDETATPIAISKPVVLPSRDRVMFAAVSRVEAALIEYPRGGRQYLPVTIWHGRHGLQILGTADEYEPQSPMMISVDQDFEMIAVANRNSRRIYLFKQGPSKSRNLDQIGVGSVEFLPQGIVVSPDGDEIMLISESRTKLAMIHDIEGWLAERTTVNLKRVALVRRIQRGLAKLDYPVGAIDGIFGVQTRIAVREFQKASGQPVTDTIDLGLALKIERTEREGNQTALLKAIAQYASGGLNGDLDALRAKVGEHCDVLSDRELCLATGNWVRVRTNHQNVQEQFCAASGHAHEAQADIYAFLTTIADYVCSRGQSCAFLRYQNPDAFAAACTDSR
jgi:DNA-binding beta-propeller fold protein YncE